MTETEDQAEKPRGRKARKKLRKEPRREHTPTPGSSHHRRSGDRKSGPATMHEKSGMHNKGGKGGANSRRHGN